MSVRAIGLVLGLGAAVLFAGCGGGPASATVTGEVKVDGVALENGVISFTAADGTGQSTTTDVTNGRYEIRTTAGKKIVQISAPVVIEKKKESNAPDAQWVEITTERLPDRFNSKTELTFEVQPGGNSKDWHLDTRKK